MEIVNFTYGPSLNWGEPELVRGDGSHILACKRYPVRKLMAYDTNGNLDKDSPRNLLPLKYVEALEQNQQIASCCRHAENHEVEAWYSSENWMRKLMPDGVTPEPRGGVPDIYILHCTDCGRKHRRFCVGGGDERPFWDVR